MDLKALIELQRRQEDRRKKLHDTVLSITPNDVANAEGLFDDLKKIPDYMMHQQLQQLLKGDFQVDSQEMIRDVGAAFFSVKRGLPVDTVWEALSPVDRKEASRLGKRFLNTDRSVFTKSRPKNILVHEAIIAANKIICHHFFLLLVFLSAQCFGG